MDAMQLVLNANLVCNIVNNNLEEVKNLLNSGAHVNFVNLFKENKTPLHEAVITGNPNMVELLLSRRANTEAKDGDNKTPMELCSLLDDQKRHEIEAVFSKYQDKSRNAVKRKLFEDDSSINKTYIKRGGTANVGQYYETKLLTMLLFRLLHDAQTESFVLGSNLDEAGAFDDVVIRATTAEGKSVVYCFQAKHKKASSEVTFDDFFNTKRSDFLLTKYFGSYLKIRYMFSPTSDHAIFQGEYEQTDLELLIFTPAVLQYAQETQCEQTTVSSLFHTKSSGNPIRIKDSKVVTDLLVNFSIDWHKKVVAQILAKLIDIQGHDTSDLSEAIKKLQQENILKTYTNQDMCFNNVGLLQLSSMQQFNSGINKEIKQISEKIEKILQEPVIPSNDQHKNLVKDFLNKFKFCSKQATEDELNEIICHDLKAKYLENDELIFSKSHDAVERWWKQSGNVPYLTKRCKIFEIALNQVRLEKYHTSGLRVIKSESVKFNISYHTKWENVFQKVSIDNPFFLNIYSSTPDLCSVGLVQYFQLHRIEFKFVLIDDAEIDIVFEVISKSELNGIIVAFLPKFSGEIIENVRVKIEKLIVITEQQYCGEGMSIGDESAGLPDLDNHCQNNLLDSLVTFQGSLIPLKTVLDSAPRELVDFNMLQQLVFSERLTISKALMDSSTDHEADKYYIDRELLDNRKGKQAPKSISDINDEVVIVAAEPGMGKTVLLHQLGKAVKKSNPGKWVVRINLLDHSKQFFQWNYDNRALNVDDVLQFLIKIILPGSSNKIGLFVKNIFIFHCRNKKVHVHVDGFDEISPDYTQIVLHLLRILANNFAEHLWITTRTGGIQEELEKMVKFKTYSLIPFSLHKIKLFFLNYWKSKLSTSSNEHTRFNDSVETLLKRYFHYQYFEGTVIFLHTPLQIKMMAMVLYNYLMNNCNPSNNQLNFESLDLITLYEQFIHLKYNVILMEEKNKIDISKPSNREQIKESFQVFQTKYKKIAFHALFKEEEVKDNLSDTEIDSLQHYLNEVKISADKTGMITSVIDGKAIFVHQTYAEFLSAHFIWEKFNIYQSDKFISFIESIWINSIIKNERGQIANFLLILMQKTKEKFSNLVSKSSALLNQMIIYPINSFREYNSYAFSFMLGIIERSLILDSNCEQMFRQVINDNAVCKQIILFLIASDNGYINILKVFTDLTTDFINATFDWLENNTALHFATKYGHIEVVKFLLENNANINSKTSMLEETALHLAAKNGFYKIVKLLLDNGAVKTNTTINGDTPLHLAAREKSLKDLSLLQARGTEFSTALRNDYASVIKLLVERGADIDCDSYFDNQTPLHVSCFEGSINATQVLLDLGANIHQGNSYGETPLHLAALKDNPEIIKLLIDNGAIVNCTTKDDGRTPLYAACLGGSLSAVELLLNLGADVNLGRTSTSHTPLHMAAYYNYPKIIKLLVDKGASINRTTTDNGRTPLFEACWQESLDASEMLLDLGANVNLGITNSEFAFINWVTRRAVPNIQELLVHQSDSTFTSFHNEAMSALQILLNIGARVSLDLVDSEITSTKMMCQDCPDIIKLLVDKDIVNDFATGNNGQISKQESCIGIAVKRVVITLDLNSSILLNIIDRGYKPLCYKGWKDRHDIIELLIDENTYRNCTCLELYEICQNTAYNALELMLNMRAVVQYKKFDKNFTPLHRAALNNCPKIAKLLIDYKANINVTTTEYDRTPLYEACWIEAKDSVETLLSLGADVHLSSTKAKFSPLHIAAYRNCIPEVIEWLRDHGANINCTTTDGQTPLYQACWNGALNSVKKLLELGANIHQATFDIAHTPLHIAAWYNFAEIVDLLCKAGANVNCQTSDNGRTPLHEAAKRGHLKTVKVLLENGADVGIRTITCGCTALCYAVEGGFDEVIQLLSKKNAVVG